MSFDVDVSQLNRLAVDLGKAGVAAVPRARMVVQKTAADIESTAKTFVPVDTGNLKNSIGSSVRGLVAEIGPTASYGAHVEFGTVRMAPYAYLGPALDRHTPGFVSAMEQVAGGIL